MAGLQVINEAVSRHPSRVPTGAELAKHLLNRTYSTLIGSYDMTAYGHGGVRSFVHYFDYNSSSFIVSLRQMWSLVLCHFFWSCILLILCTTWSECARIQSSLAYLDSHVARFSTVLYHPIRFISPNNQCGSTVEIESCDCQDMRDSTLI